MKMKISKRDAVEYIISIAVLLVLLAACQAISQQADSVDAAETSSIEPFSIGVELDLNPRFIAMLLGSDDATIVDSGFVWNGRIAFFESADAPIVLESAFEETIVQIHNGPPPLQFAGDLLMSS